ncbi:BOS complex subunit NOMO3 [Cylas formicarius]|uniref:BOS complex subunit NOMO3 n=1 Tax=Cylas formicarius TaxID=197179 RepID=UPI002958D957|nr:BOS complex subunit NOMO3 [Cylas formicarius]
MFLVMNKFWLIFPTFLHYFSLAFASDVLGCGGFIKSHVPIDFSKIEVKLITRQGIVKDRTNCAPNNGYYFLPIYDKGEFILQLSPPPGWTLTPKEVQLNIDGRDDCSLGKDINFVFKGFGITGKVESLGGNKGGPKGVLVELQSTDDRRITQTDDHGNFFFSPVFPGVYTVSISHPKWQIYKKSFDVAVKEGNTELPSQSFLVHGYDVTGKILTAQGNPVKDTIVALVFKDGGKTAVDKCNKNELVEFQLQNRLLCHVTSNDKGEFEFPVVPYGRYSVVPYYRKNNIYYQPEKIDFEVGHDSVELPQHFLVIGFSVSGKVTNGKEKGISNAKIYLNGQEVAKTDEFGNYLLEKLKVAKYKLKAEAEDLLFDEITLYIDTNIKMLPDLVPSAFKVCGEVISDKPQAVAFSKIGSTDFVTTKTNFDNQFCQYLAPGNYKVQVLISEEDKKNRVQFFPLSQLIEVTSEHLFDVVFSQLKSNITGKLDCIQINDCEDLDVILKSGFDEITVFVKDSKYYATNMSPGFYEIILKPNKYCWKTNKHTLNVNSLSVEAPHFIQTGYLVNVVSSHDVKILYNTIGDGKLSEVKISRGTTSFCVNAPGEYKFLIRSCHSYDSDTFTYNTNSKNNEITLNAIKHTVTLAIESDANYGPIEVNLEIDGEKTVETVSYANGNYDLRLILKPEAVAIVTPQSDLLVFKPEVLNVVGVNDCENIGRKINARKGKIFQGKLIPPLPGVVVTVDRLDNDQLLTVETDSKGLYKFPPLDATAEYHISAQKDSYIITGPDDDGNFRAQKLAEIIIEVVDHKDKSPLSGVLVSLSGGESYRRNLQTDQIGIIAFYSLSAGDYFLKPMLKEYQFEPASKLVTIREGETVKVQLGGKRVAFSAYGKITSLNKDPIENVNVIASGMDNCTSYSEETTSDQMGKFRIRGLQPYCSFKVYVEVGKKYGNNLERTSPEFIEVKNINEDVKNLSIIVFYPIPKLTVLVKVYAENADHYKALKLKLYCDSDGPTLLHSISLENQAKGIEGNYGLLIAFPALTVNGKLYSVHLESSQIKSKARARYFNANSTFKYIELDFKIKSTIIEQPIKQTSLWTVVFIILVLAGLYNIQFLSTIVKENVNFNFNHLVNLLPLQNSRKVASYNETDIDQIVQDINNIRSKKKNN